MSMAVFTTFETPRLRLRHFTDADLALFMAYRNDPEVARYQGWEGISEPEARVFLQEQKEIQPGVPGHWFQIAVELKETGMLVGDCALEIEEHDERQAEIGYTLSRGYQGRGIASEAVSPGFYATFFVHACKSRRLFSWWIKKVILVLAKQVSLLIGFLICFSFII